MLCYKDRMYCPFYKDCSKGRICDRACKPAIVKSAQAMNILISLYSNTPECFISRR